MNLARGTILKSVHCIMEEKAPCSWDYEEPLPDCLLMFPTCLLCDQQLYFEYEMTLPDCGITVTPLPAETKA